MPVTITTAVSGWWASTSRVNSMPDSPGMLTSLSTRATFVSLSTRRAAAAESAVRHS